VKIKVKKITLLISLLIGSVSFAWAGVEIKGVGGVSGKLLADSWAAHYEAAKLKYESKNRTDAINQFLHKGCDFVLVDSPLTTAQTIKAKSHNLLYLPLALSTQAVVYNLPGIPSGQLRLTPKLLSDIFLGNIKKWNDPALRAINPKLSLPDIDVLVLHQSDESSMNDFFPAYLAKQNPKWTSKREKDKNLHWPVGQNINGNIKVLAKLRQWAGVIVVIDFSFAQEKNLPIAQIQNEAGQYVEPSSKSIAEAVSNKVGSEPNQKISKGYPLASVVLAVVYQDYDKVFHKPERGRALIDFLNWALSPEGQSIVSEDFFTPLSEAVLAQSLDKVKSIQHDY